MKCKPYSRATITAQNFKFNGGSEVEEMTDWYSTPFRKYDPALGRFHGVDALADMYTGINPSHFGMNNPVNYNDPTGLTSAPKMSDTERGEKHSGGLEGLGSGLGPDNMAYYGRGGSLYSQTWGDMNQRFAALALARAKNNNEGNLSSLIGAFINVALNYSAHGGSYSSSAGISFYSSGYDALSAGMGYQDANNSWSYTQHGDRHATSVSFFGNTIGNTMKGSIGSDIGNLDVQKSQMPSSILDLPDGYDIKPDWMEIAYFETGTSEITDFPDVNNVRVLEYLATTNVKSEMDETNWCSAFVNWCVKQAGHEGTNNALARSWMAWGQPVSEPIYGAIAVFWRGNKNGKFGHVGFVAGYDKNYIYLLGGNQGSDYGRVSIVSRTDAQLLGFRWPTK